MSQQGDAEFIGLLNSIRIGKGSERHLEILNSRKTSGEILDIEKRS